MNGPARVSIVLLAALLGWPASAHGATRRNNRDRNASSISVVRRASEPADWELVRLVGTEVGRRWGEPVMLVHVRPVRGGRTVTLLIHNSGWKKSGNDTFRRNSAITQPEVPGALANVLKRHKPGDVIAVRVQTIDGLAVLHSARAHDGKPGEYEADSAFFVKAEQKQSGGGRTTTQVSLMKYGKTTVVPLMETQEKDDKGRTIRTTRKDLAEAVAGLTKGDLVEVDMGTSRSSRAIRHIAPWQEPFVGQFAKLGQTEIDGAKHLTVEIRSSLGGMPLMIQQVTSDGVKYRDDYRMARFVKTLKPNQYVAFKTRTQDAKTILWLIGPTDRTTSNRGAGGAGGAPKPARKAAGKGNKKANKKGK